MGVRKKAYVGVGVLGTLTGLILVPKCPLCLMAYGAWFLAVGASFLKQPAVAVGLATLAVLLMWKLSRRLRNTEGGCHT